MAFDVDLGGLLVTIIDYVKQMLGTLKIFANTIMPSNPGLVYLGVSCLVAYLLREKLTSWSSIIAIIVLIYVILSMV